MVSVVGVIRWRVSDSVCARAPSVQQESEVSAVALAVAINVAHCSRGSQSLVRAQYAEVRAVDLVVDEQVCDALASGRTGVSVTVGRGGGNLALVGRTVGVAIGLDRIRVRWVVS